MFLVGMGLWLRGVCVVSLSILALVFADWRRGCEGG